MSSKMTVEHGRDIEIMLVFDDDDGCLSETQKSNGLTRTFLFVNAEQNKTISDLRSYIIDTFPLESISPNDIHLSINGFSLLPSEQTCKLHNKVIRCVKRTTALPIDKVIDIDQSEYPKKRKAREEARILNKKKINCNNNDEASRGTPQHAENEIHVKQDKHLNIPGSDELADELDWDVCLDKLSEKSLGMSAAEVYLMCKTCYIYGRHYGPMSILYHIRHTLLSGLQEGVTVVGIKILLDKVKDGLKGLQDADVNYYASKSIETSKSTETSTNDDPAVEEEGFEKSMDLDDTEGAQSFESIQPSGGALKFAQGLVAFCKLLSKERFHPVFVKEGIEVHDIVLGIIDDIITADDLARAHQLFEDWYAHIMLWEGSSDDEQ